MPPKADSALTIVLTLKDRPEFTRRWMRFMNDRRCPFKVLIADGGRDESIESHLRDQSNYPNLSYEYVRYPYDADWATFCAKQMDACERVQTEYLLLADNDDFYIPERLGALVEFMSTHPEYAGCRGSLVQFALLDSNGRKVGAVSGAGYRAAHHEGRSIEGATPVERVETYFNELVRYYHQMTWYSVLRARPFAEILRRVYAYEWPDVVLNEMLVLLSLLKEGKMKVIDGEPFYVRQEGTSQSESSLLADNNLLETFLINDVFHQLTAFLVAEEFGAGESDRVRMLRAVANYVGTWCATCSDRYRHAGMGARAEKLARRALAASPMAFGVAQRAVFRFSHVLRGTRRIKSVRVPEIEPYILAPR